MQIFQVEPPWRCLPHSGQSAALQNLRIGGDPLHRHLLDGLGLATPPALGFVSPGAWSVRLAAGELEAALVSVPGSAAGAMGEGDDPAIGCGATLSPALADPTTVAIALGCRPLALLYAHRHLQGQQVGEGNRCPRFLLPPQGHLPLLHADLRRLDLLGVRTCGATETERWLALLWGERLPLPAHPSLLEQAPWREAGLIAVPPPDPLWEALWLLVRENEPLMPEVQAIAQALRGELHLSRVCDP